MYIMLSGAIARTGFYWGCPNTVSSRGSRGRSHVVQTMFRMDLKMSIGLNRFYGAVRTFEDLADGEVASGSMVAQPAASTYGTPLATVAANVAGEMSFAMPVSHGR